MIWQNSWEDQTYNNKDLQNIFFYNNNADRQLSTN